ADVCVAPFRDTPVTRCKSPLKIVEYMSCGKAVVASNVGEVPRMLGGAGVLVKAGDVRSLSDGIELLLKDPCLRKKLGEFARRRAENRYNWAQTAQTLVAAYESIYAI
ncbi:MAG: glycosyltransferase, partial [Candidatus Omnitrophica bacterium]|nr:glycosyltransferase [Candidatus Omnitrophota bacterium]